ncbi:hypothetical protein LOTGIDRAFT_236959 [Lottia gigantea]|uniref:Uncharacterized protein n=1 Tax=Lottia gigantea TaxID=225164 RepID=V3YWQ3_LOTGI|nr:hypothetical protein LOTGIDRAFT_236959 [Lottia gigantea]ESO82463.1 hypothetical protein LOTGIDRAFT_236959 [Lottia gigantea]
MVGQFLDKRTRWEKMRHMMRVNPESVPMMVFVGAACIMGGVFCVHSLYFKPDVWINKYYKTQPSKRLEHDDVRKYFTLSSKPVLRPETEEGDSDEIRQLRKEIGF